MAKDWILNQTMNRFQLNFKRNVGSTSENIRKCSPSSLDEWKKYYFENVKSEEHIIELGKKLHIKITENVTAEIETISQQDCIEYMLSMVLDKTYDGYMTEINTIYGIVQKEIDDTGFKIKPSSDEWDRKYNVDFHIEVNNGFIGIQIKPVNEGIQIPEIFKQKKLQEISHKKFTELFRGSVVYIYSHTIDGKKTIVNPDALDEIQNEIKRLQNLEP